MIAFLSLCSIAFLATLVWLKVANLNRWWKFSPLLFVLACLVVLIFPSPGQTVDTNVDSIAHRPNSIEKDKKQTKNRITPAPKLLATPLSLVHFEHVRFNDSIWAPHQKMNRLVSLPQALRTTRCLLDDFEYLAGKRDTPVNDPKSIRHRWSDMFFHNILEAMAATIELEPDATLQAELDRRMAVVAGAQEDNGYLQTEHQMTKHVQWGDYDNHELFTAGHFIEAAVTHHRLTGSTTMLDVAIKLADHIEDVFSSGRAPAPGDRSSHPGVEMALPRLYDVTGDRRYLDRAGFLVEYARHAEHIDDADCNGHAVKSTNFFAGMIDVAMRTGDNELLATADRVWRDMVNRKMYITGGLGESCAFEGFRYAYELSDKMSNAETCATMGNMFMSHRLGLATGQAHYVDMLERALYNGVLGCVGLDGEGIFYAVILANRGGQERDPRMWCCVSNWIRFVPQVGGLLYATAPDALYVNLFAQSNATIELAGQPVEVTQTTQYPWEPSVQFTVSPASPATFALKLRVPGWSSGATARVNGKKMDAQRGDDGYLTLNRKWTKGDTVDYAFAMPVQRMEANRQVKTSQGSVALVRGPLVYCVEGVDNGGTVFDLALPPEAKLETAWEEDLLGGVVTLNATGRRRVSEEWRDELYRVARPRTVANVKAVPFFAWANRAKSEMRVWIPETTGLAEDRLEPTNLATNARIDSSTEADEVVLGFINDGGYPISPGKWQAWMFQWSENKETDSWTGRPRIPKLGTKEWISLTFDEPKTVRAVEVYWLDEYWFNEFFAPESWHVEFLTPDGAWQKVRSPSIYDTYQCWFSHVDFEPVRTTAVRIVAQLQKDIVHRFFKDEDGHPLKKDRGGGVYEIRVLGF
jgi:DUF1680 family protein